MPDRTLDNYAALSHKAAISEPSIARNGLNGPFPWDWVGAENKRRLVAYTILEAYRRNVARWYVTASSEEVRDIRREYGDPDLLMRQVASSVLGRGYRIRVEDGDDTESGPEKTRQDELAEWSEDEQMELKLLENEHNALSLGDSVLWFSYSSRKKRVRVHVIDPGFYFPVYQADADGEDYPSRVHLAWEFEDWDRGSQRDIRYVRRITFELRDVPAYSVPYQDEPASQRCYMTDATWTIDALDWEMRDRGPDDFKPSKAVFRTNEDGQSIDDLDLGVDFIPVVHLANFGGHPWGTSLFTNVAHVIDDIQMCDTDAAEAADVAGGPPIVVAGADGSEAKTYGPKTVWTVPTGGQASVLDTSGGLDSLENHGDKLYKRFTVNSRVPREILGITGAAEAPSGTALALSFNPFKRLMIELRLARKFKYRLVLKMVQRLMVTYGQWEAPVHKAWIEFGAALPEDLEGTVAMVRELANADRPLISRRTGLGLIADAGLNVEDLDAEIEAVHGEDWDAARLIHDATDSVEMAAEHLGIELPEETREERVAKEQQETQLEADAEQAKVQVAAQAERAATVQKQSPGNQGAGTGTRNPGAASGSNTGNGRRRGRGNR